jgi:hypothetical protein
MCRRREKAPSLDIYIVSNNGNTPNLSTYKLMGIL